MIYDVLIVGGGHAGAQAAVALRQQHFAGTIAIVGDEPHLPYERPPLSKDYFSGEKSFERLLIRPASFWQERQIDMLLDTRVTGVDVQAHEVVTQDQRRIGYGTLIWATGGRPRRLTCEGHDLPGVHGIRTRDDIDAILARMDHTDRICLIGGGYIGLEVAAVLSKLGKSVALLEAQPRLLARVAGAPLSAFFEAEHRAHGVDIRLNCCVEGITASEGELNVRLGDGDSLASDLIIVGIGIVPAVEPLLAAGAVGTNGVAVNGRCLTSLPDVYAIGDCACHENSFADGGWIRLESVQNANDQAAVVAKALTGSSAPYHAVPWFWSNQYDLRLQTVGLSGGHDSVVLRGYPATRSFSVIYLKNGRIIALDCVNATKDYVQGRKLVESGARLPFALLADPAVPLKDIMPSADMDVC